MTNEAIERFTTELKSSYSGAVTTRDGNRTLVKLPVVSFPEGCRPATSEALLVFDPAAPIPEFYLAGIPTLKSGAVPVSGQASVAGETWNVYSYAVHHWDSATHTAVQFVEAKLRRFVLAQ